MYEIYINDTPLILCEASNLSELPDPSEKILVARYPGKAKFLFNYIDMLEKTNRFEMVILFSEEVDRLWRDFNSHFKLIEAAGGIVFNQEKQALLIFRRDMWDLPKGKIDPGESPQEAAIREVQEETGLEKLTLGEEQPVTYHTYQTKKGNRILKRTYWYKMDTPEVKLSPQTEEDIEKAVWVDLSEFLQKDISIYKSIKGLLELIEN